MPKMTKNNARGVKFPAPIFPLSCSEYMQNIKIVEAINSEKNMPVRVMNAAGYVQKIPAVEVLL
jgi:hypothetical protein